MSTAGGLVVKRTMKLQVLLALTVLAAGCAAPPLRQIKFDSEPSGARVWCGIGANEKLAKPVQYVGQTPCEWAPPQDRDGKFIFKGIVGYSVFVPPVILFEARWTNGQISRVTFHGGTAVKSRDDIPQAVFFEPAGRQ